MIRGVLLDAVDEEAVWFGGLSVVCEPEIGCVTDWDVFDGVVFAVLPVDDVTIEAVEDVICAVVPLEGLPKFVELGGGGITD